MIRSDIMKIQENLYIINNLKHIKQLHDAGISHAVIAHFYQSENIKIDETQISALVHANDALHQHPISSGKLTALMKAKADLVDDEQFPCPV